MKLQNEMFFVEESADSRVRVRLNAGHYIYGAHFPGNPITPGVCIVQMVGELLSNRVGRPLKLSKIVNLKFVAPISPVTTPCVEVLFSAVANTPAGFQAKGAITADKVLMTKFSIVYE